MRGTAIVNVEGIARFFGEWVKPERYGQSILAAKDIPDTGLPMVTHVDILVNPICVQSFIYFPSTNSMAPVVIPVVLPSMSPFFISSNGVMEVWFWKTTYGILGKRVSTGAS